MSENANKKRLFEILDEMNVHDIENETRLVSVSGNFISADLVKQGSKIAMGTTSDALHQIAADKVIPILLLIDKKEYNKRSKQ